MAFHAALPVKWDGDDAVYVFEETVFLEFFGIYFGKVISYIWAIVILYGMDYMTGFVAVVVEKRCGMFYGELFPKYLFKGAMLNGVIVGEWQMKIARCAYTLFFYSQSVTTHNASAWQEKV